MVWYDFVMSDETALLAAIFSQPDEDTPRLAYADWLDENGDVDSHARAEYIRLQIEAFRGGLSGSPHAFHRHAPRAVLEKKLRRIVTCAVSGCD